jgi:DinB family protein
MTAATIAPAAEEYPPGFAGYVAQVPPGDIVARLRRQIGETAALLRPLSPDQARYRYAPGKWSTIEVLGHLSDTERVMAYRALRIARADETPLAGFDENTYVPAADFERRSLADVLAEFEAVRLSTTALFASLVDGAWGRWGVVNGNRITVRALAHVIAGHELHHVGVLRTRYLAGAGTSAPGR